VRRAGVALGGEKVLANSTLGASIVALGECLARARSFRLDGDLVLTSSPLPPSDPPIRAKGANMEVDRCPPTREGPPIHL